MYSTIASYSRACQALIFLIIVIIEAIIYMIKAINLWDMTILLIFFTVAFHANIVICIHSSMKHNMSLI
jgi:uncharacterized membrane protein